MANSFSPTVIAFALTVLHVVASRALAELGASESSPVDEPNTKGVVQTDDAEPIQATASKSLAANSPTAPMPGRDWKTDGVRYLGVNSCSTSGCHGTIHGVNRSEYLRWRCDDPHAKAWEVLTSKQSAEIAERLRLDAPAQNHKVCLACHASTPPVEQRGATFAVSEGVGCETCHGPAHGWLKQHFHPDWKTQSAQEKNQSGMSDLTSPVGIARMCATCHVGSQGREVDHALLAAGHPPLRFEAFAWFEGLSQHWQRSAIKDPAFPARLWLIGQAEQARTQLQQVVSAADEHRWPEFSQFDCYSCHRPVRFGGTGLRGSATGAEGLAWGQWTVPLFNALAESECVDKSAAPSVDLAKALGVVRAEARLTGGGHGRLQSAAVEGRDLLDHWMIQVESTPLTDARLKAMLLTIASGVKGETSNDWYEVWQRSLAIHAVYTSLCQTSPTEKDVELEAELKTLNNQLQTPATFVTSDACTLSCQALMRIRDRVVERYASVRQASTAQ